MKPGLVCLDSSAPSLPDIVVPDLVCLCKNKGACRRRTSGVGYECVCDGFFGIKCEKGTYSSGVAVNTGFRHGQ